jgi:hypothetical protein
MAKKRLQRRWVVGKEYRVEGGGQRRMKLVGRGRIGWRETLFFQPIRRARKTRKG